MLVDVESDRSAAIRGEGGHFSAGRRNRLRDSRAAGLDPTNALREE
jgi:hypothetical protein